MELVLDLDVVALAAGEGVDAGAPDQDVVSVAPDEHVVTVATEGAVVVSAAVEGVLAGPADEEVRSLPAVDGEGDGAVGQVARVDVVVASANVQDELIERPVSAGDGDRGREPG